MKFITLAPMSPQNPSILQRMVTSLIFILVTTWLILLVIFYFFQERVVFFPSSTMTTTPAAAGLGYEEISLTTSDGVEIFGWYVPHPEPVAHLLFLHGNAGNISHRLDSLALFHQLQLSVLIIDYRGYGRSQGRTTEQGTYMDARAAWDYLLQQRQVPAKDIIIFGRSLGGAVAAGLATEVEPGAIILESTFTSIKAMGHEHYPYLPVTLIARMQYDTLQRVASFKAPLLVIHSKDDHLIPFKFGESIYQEASTAKQMLTIHGDHNAGFLLSRDHYLQGIQKFITTHVAPGGD